MTIYFIPDLCKSKDERFLDDLQEEFECETFDEILRYTQPYLFSDKLDDFRFSSFWILPNGKLYPIKGGSHEHTARAFIACNGRVFNEDSLSNYAVRYSDWLKMRLPRNRLTDNQVNTISDLSNHKNYRLFMELLVKEGY